MKIGVQTFTIRKMQKRDIEKAYLPLIEMGILNVEIGRMKFTEENALKVKSLIECYGLNVTSIQVKPKHVFHHMDEIVQFCHLTGCTNVVISMLPFSCILGNEQKFYDFIGSLDKTYDEYQKHGINLGYHHHDWEYITLSNGRTRMEELLSKTKRIMFVHDTYWTAKCGQASWKQVQQFGSRLMGIHLRDMTLKKKGLKVLAKDAPVGTGVIDFERIFEMAQQVGCRYGVIEQNSPHPYEDIRISFENCRKFKENRSIEEWKRNNAQ